MRWVGGGAGSSDHSMVYSFNTKPRQQRVAHIKRRVHQCSMDSTLERLDSSLNRFLGSDQDTDAKKTKLKLIAIDLDYQASALEVVIRRLGECISSMDSLAYNLDERGQGLMQLYSDGAEKAKEEGGNSIKGLKELSESIKTLCQDQ